jgi:hypothetical protein
MNAIGFPQANVKLSAPQPPGPIPIEPLYAWTDGQRCVSCWRLSWRERLRVLCRGQMWLHVLSGSSQPPVAADTTNPFTP